METTVAKWGNSLALRIPKRLAQEAGLVEHSHVTLSQEDGEILVRLCPGPSLDDLLSGINEDNLHAEVTTGKRTGREAW